MITPSAQRTRWKGREIALITVYREEDECLRQGEAHRRTFLLECGDGVVRAITGYRGGQGPLARRGLPVVDARLLVDLVFEPAKGVLLDPFAGAGGVVVEAKSSGWRTVSLDIDRALRYGLHQFTGKHVVGSAIALPLAGGSVDAIASEPPYHPTALDIVVSSVPELARVLRRGGHAALLVGSSQARGVRRAGEEAGLKTEVDEEIDRKGTQVVCLCWAKQVAGTESADIESPQKEGPIPK